MHPRLEELSNLLDTHRATLRAAVDSVPTSLRGTRPDTDRWSVAEVLEHLGIVEQRVTHTLGTQLTAAKAAGLGPETEMTSVLESFDVGRLLDRSKRFMSGEASRPKGALDAAEAWDALERSRTGLRTLIAEADGFALGGITLPHPAFGPLDMYQWIAFLAGHDARHADQIREVGAALLRDGRAPYGGAGFSRP